MAILFPGACAEAHTHPPILSVAAGAGQTALPATDATAVAPRHGPFGGVACCWNQLSFPAVPSECQARTMVQTQTPEQRAEARRGARGPHWIQHKKHGCPGPRAAVTRCGLCPSVHGERARPDRRRLSAAGLPACCCMLDTTGRVGRVRAPGTRRGCAWFRPAAGQEMSADIGGKPNRAGQDRPTCEGAARARGGCNFKRSAVWCADQTAPAVT